MDVTDTQTDTGTMLHQDMCRNSP